MPTPSLSLLPHWVLSARAYACIGLIGNINLSNVSAYGTNWPDCIREDFWFIVVTEGNEDETEIIE